MAQCATLTPLGSEFDTFLFAAIGEEGNGMVLSVLSALTRRGVDPWQEAGELARLPPEAATRRLASLISGSTGASSVTLDFAAIAGSLIALLPHGVVGPLRQKLPAARAITNFRILTFVIIVAFLLGAQFIVASPRAPQPDAESPSSGALPPQAPLSNSGQ